MYPANQRARNLVTALIVVVVLVLCLGLVNLLSRAGKIKLTLQVAPSVATIVLDGKKVRTGELYVSPGKHTVQAQLHNFTSANATFNTGTSKTYNYSVALQPTNPAAYKFLQDNPKYQYEREAIGGLTKQSLTYATLTPLIKLLPVINVVDGYSIDYGQSNNQEGAAFIISNSSPTGRQKALQWIEKQGYEPYKLEVQFTDYSNPLLGEN